MKKGQPPRWGLTIASAQRRQHSVCPVLFRARGRGAWAELLPRPTPLRRATTCRARPARPPFPCQIKKGQPPGRETGVQLEAQRSGSGVGARPPFPTCTLQCHPLTCCRQAGELHRAKDTRRRPASPFAFGGLTASQRAQSLPRLLAGPSSFSSEVSLAFQPSSAPGGCRVVLTSTLWCAECSAHFQDLPLGAVRGVIPRVTSYHLPFSARFMLLFCPALFRARASRVRKS